ncbi:ScbR family autoregulator-binding transcription factor [Streptomyces sp. NPDC006368]|uniref:ScbR family autoregulator-binding transcription factor n=1 Tax=Streptomyces sp. NPDC006368 TaxID=3156760 RepID=UPI0033A54951
MTKQERAARTREAVIRSAAEVFDRDGFALSSLTSISTRAGVSNGALYFHFVNKNALAEAVEDEAVTALRRIAPPWGDATGPALQGLVDATHTLALHMREDVILRAGFGLSADTTWKGGGGSLRRYWAEWVGDGLAAAARQGALADGVTLEDATVVIAATTLGFEALGRTDPQWFSGHMFTRLWRLLLPRLTTDQTVRAVAPADSCAGHGVGALGAAVSPRWWPVLGFAD